MRWISLASMTLTAVWLLRAEDFWLTTPPGKWSQLEIKQMVTDSPWSKRANVRWSTAAAAGRAQDIRIPSPPEIMVRWDSAFPILEACANGGMERHLFSCVSKLLYLSGLEEKFDQLKAQYYVVGLSNYPKPPREAGVTEHSDAGNAALEKVSRRIQESAFLRFKHRSAARPAHVISLPAGQSLLVVFFFPRTDGISLPDEQVSIEVADGLIELKATFDLQ